MRYTVVLLQETDGRYSVSIPALPGCFTQGDTFTEAVTNAIDAATLYLTDNDDPPVEDPGTVVVSVEITVPTGETVAA